MAYGEPIKIGDRVHHWEIALSDRELAALRRVLSGLVYEGAMPTVSDVGDLWDLLYRLEKPIDRAE